MLRVISMAAAQTLASADAALAQQNFPLAETLYRKAITEAPGSATAWAGLADIALSAEQFPQSLALYRHALSLDPDDIDIQVKLAKQLLRMDLVDEAIDRLHPLCGRNLAGWTAGVWIDYGNVLRSLGRAEEAVHAYRRGVAAAPQVAEHHSALLYGMHFVPNIDPGELLREHLRWNDLHAAPLRSKRRPFAPRGASSQLRIGFVSPDFDHHVVARFLEPFLRCHDRERLHITCYSATLRPDAMTDTLRAHAVQWRDITLLSDDHVADLIRSENIDILIDLTMHMERNRLLLFARRPAPIQATYLAYCSTTGLETMDFRLSDPFLDPPPPDDAPYSERTVLLSETYWCYPGWEEMPQPAEWPDAAPFTFGSMNHFAKISADTLDAWARILQPVEGSQLKILCPPGRARHRVRDAMAAHNVGADRILFIDRAAPADYFRTLGSIHLHLDPLHYSGGTTTCDATWMGTPTLTFRGNLAVGRGGVSLMNNLGLPEFVARTPDQYIDAAVRIARDRDALRALRKTLRGRLQASPVGDAPRFARAMENALFEMARLGPRKDS